MDRERYALAGAFCFEAASCETALEAKECRILRAENPSDAIGEQSQRHTWKYQVYSVCAHDSTTIPSRSVPKWKQFELSRSINGSSVRAIHSVHRFTIRFRPSSLRALILNSWHVSCLPKEIQIIRAANLPFELKFQTLNIAVPRIQNSVSSFESPNTDLFKIMQILFVSYSLAAVIHLEGARRRLLFWCSQCCDSGCIFFA